MLTLATFVLEKFGGDTMDDVRRRWTTTEHGRDDTRCARRRRPAYGRGLRDAGLTGTDEAGSGGDD